MAQILNGNRSAQRAAARKRGSVSSVAQKGAAITDAELALAKEGKYLEFWHSRYKAGDPVARTALNGWDPDFQAPGVMGAIEKKLAGYTWMVLEVHIKDNNLSVSMQQIATDMALAHANAVIRDPNNLLSSQQVATYHHTVFAKYDIPPGIFGGTHNPIAPKGALPPAVSYDFMWCRGCDSN